MIRLRALTTDDIPDLLSAYVDLYRELSPTALQITQESLDSALLDRNTTIVGAFDGSHLVGIATLGIIHISNKSLGFIEGVVVAERYRGKGIGELLMKFLLTHASECGVSSCQLTCNNSPERALAHDLYKRLGFTPADTTVYRKKLK